MKKIIFMFAIIFSTSTILLSCNKISKNQDESSTKPTENNVQQDTTDKNENKDTNNNTTKQNTNTNTTNNNKSDTESEKLLNDIKNKAIKGSVIDSNFILGTPIDNVISELGNPSSKDYVADAKGTYYNFDSYNLSFGCNKGGRVFEIRTLNKNLNILNLNSVENFFGKPDYNLDTDLKETIIGYKLTNDFKILFVFDTANSKLKHYSVLYPSITKNSMANDNGREW